MAIVGGGTVGSVLGRILVDRGEKIVCVVSRTINSALKAGRFLRCRTASTSLETIPAGTDLVFITTPHGTVENVAQNLARLEHLDFKSLSVCHASGMLTAGVLAPLADRGATTFSFHPLQTFPRDFEPKDIVESARGIYFGIDGSEKGVRQARHFAHKLGGHAIEIPPAMREFYHASCVVATNHLTTLLWILEQMFARFGAGKKKFYEVFNPIITATLRNVEMTSPAKSLSGPIARGGSKTVEQHLRSIDQFAPDVIPYFVALSKETVRLARSKGSINPEQVHKLLSVIDAYNHQSHIVEKS